MLCCNQLQRLFVGISERLRARLQCTFMNQVRGIHTLSVLSQQHQLTRALQLAPPWVHIGVVLITAGGTCLERD